MAVILCACGGSDAPSNGQGAPAAPGVAPGAQPGPAPTGAAPPPNGSTPPPVVVLACDDLPAANTWSNVIPTVSPVKMAASVAVDPLHAGVVYVGTSQGLEVWAGPGSGIFKSSDCGAHWQKMNTGANAASIDSGVPWGLTLDPLEPDTLYVSNGYGDDNGLFKTTNGGVDWQRVFPPLDDPDHLGDIVHWVQGVAMSPTNPKHLLLMMHEGCKAPFAPACMAESADGGATWRLLKIPLPGFSHSAGALFIDESTWLIAGGADGLWRTIDKGATWEEKKANSAFPTMVRGAGDILLVGSPYDGVLRSTDHGASWTSLANSPPAASLIDDGTHVIAGREFAFDNRPFTLTTLAAPTTWSPVESPDIANGGSGGVAYDSAHHLLYAAGYGSGLWRLVTP